MAEGVVRRIYVPDMRGTDEYLRMTWHAEQQVVVVSHWQGSVCTAATRVGVQDASEVIGFLAGALADAATQPVARSTAPTLAPLPPPPWWRRWYLRLRRPLGEVIALRRPAPRWSEDLRSG